MLNFTVYKALSYSLFHRYPGKKVREGKKREGSLRIVRIPFYRVEKTFGNAGPCLASTARRGRSGLLNIQSQVIWFQALWSFMKLWQHYSTHLLLCDFSFTTFVWTTENSGTNFIFIGSGTYDSSQPVVNEDKKQGNIKNNLCSINESNARLSLFSIRIQEMQT